MSVHIMESEDQLNIKRHHEIVYTGQMKSANKKNQTIHFTIYESPYQHKVKWEDYENGRITYGDGKIIELSGIPQTHKIIHPEDTDFGLYVDFALYYGKYL